MAADDWNACLKGLEDMLGVAVDFKEPVEEKKPEVEDEVSTLEHETKHPDEEARDTSGDQSWGVADTHEWVKLKPDKPPKPPSKQPENQPPDQPSQILDYSTFEVGKPVDKDVHFCSWDLLLEYPEVYIGKTNKPLVKPYFDKITESCVWDFFYIHDMISSQDWPYLLVPTAQVEEFLFFINKELEIALKIPDGARERFHVQFGSGGTPRPRYLQRSKDQKCLVVEHWPTVHDEDIYAYKSAKPRHQAQWNAALGQIRTRPPVGKQQKGGWKAARKLKIRQVMLRDVHHLLGLDKQGGEDVVFVCIDVEAIEETPNPISEVGIAILETKHILDVPRESNGSSWWPMIKAYHLRTKEYSGLVNHRYVHGCPGAFDFGTSTFPTEEDLPCAIMDVLDPYIKAGRDLVFVGHDFKHDEQYLLSIGIAISSLQPHRGTIDTQAMHQAWSGKDQGRGLQGVLADLEVAYKNLHNAGNDAVYTLRAMLGIAVTPPRQNEVTEASDSPAMTEASEKV